jgi:hypothetical protein
MRSLLWGIFLMLLFLFSGAFVNMGLIIAGMNLIPPPEGIDFSVAESLAKGAHLLEPKHFIFPFLAHALGTFVAAFLLVFILKSSSLSVKLSWVIGILFFLGGLMMVFEIPAPLWFDLLDLSLAYFPMVFLAQRLSRFLLPK